MNNVVPVTVAPRESLSCDLLVVGCFEGETPEALETAGLGAAWRAAVAPAAGPDLAQARGLAGTGRRRRPGQRHGPPRLPPAAPRRDRGSGRRPAGRPRPRPGRLPLRPFPLRPGRPAAADRAGGGPAPRR